MVNIVGMKICENACDSRKENRPVIPSNSTSVLSTTPNVFERFHQYYSGLLFVLIAFIDNSLNVRNFHPVKLGKMFTKYFNGITNISPVSSLRVKFSFDSLINANGCLAFTWLHENKYTASIPNFSTTILQFRSYSPRHMYHDR